MISQKFLRNEQNGNVTPPLLFTFSSNSLPSIQTRMTSHLSEESESKDSQGFSSLNQSGGRQLEQLCDSDCEGVHSPRRRQALAALSFDGISSVSLLGGGGERRLLRKINEFLNV